MAKTKRLLMLAYFWPPMGGAGVQRALKLAKAAPDFGWEVSVVAGQARPGDLQDASMLAEVPAEMTVQRRDHLRVHTRLLTRWTPPDPYVAWYGPALNAARELALVQPFDALLSTSMPYTTHLVARTLKHELRLPWLADLRDPWTDNRFLAAYQGNGLRSRFRRAVDGRMERGVYDDADLVSVTAGPLRDLLIDRWHLLPERVLLARNGFDEADFDGVLPLPSPRPPVDPAERQDRALEVLFAGSLYEGYTIEPFLAAWEALLARRPDVRIRLVAHTQAKGLLQRLVERFPVAGPLVEIGPRVPHREIVARYGRADMLVLSTLDALSIPGKLFEYIRSGTPVFACSVPDAESHALLGDTQTGVAVPHDDPMAAAAQLERWYDAWRQGQPLTQPDGHAVELLERRVSYRKMFAALDDLTEQFGAESPH